MPRSVQALAIVWVGAIAMWFAARKDLDRALGNPKKWDVSLQGRIVRLEGLLIAISSLALLGALVAWAAS